MGDTQLSVVIPAFNAEHCLKGCVERVAGYLDETNISYELIIVNDGSSDNTAALIDSLNRDIPKLRGIHLERNRGKGYAVKTGMHEARGTLRLFMDADGATDISYYPKAEAKMGEGFDIVIASRSAKDAPGARQVVPQSTLRRTMGVLGNALIRLFGVSGIHDTQCGFKMFTSDAAMELFEKSRISGWAFDVELLLLGRQCGYRIGVLPVEWYHNEKSSMTTAGYFKTLRDLIKIRLWMIRGTYGV